MTEFVCPTCNMPQILPPEIMMSMLPLPLPPLNHQAHGIDPTKIQVPCINCKAILNVPHGLSRFTCPQCCIELVVPEEVNEVAIDVEREEHEGGMAGETFTEYRPPKVSIGLPHPDPIVETSSLSAVQPPEPTYDLKIKDEIVVSNALSCLQIETIIYACQRHLQKLPNGTRAGFFVGDGAGVGKGRTIAGLIWENWHHGRRKALWISVGSDLKFDARRDLDDVGAKCIKVHALNKLPYSKLDSKSVGVTDGVIFSTYNSLIASSEKGRSRLQQLLQWCGSDYEGLVVFDECHKAKNLIPEAGSLPTRTGEGVVELQTRLPEARVIYCSATGASEPRNLGYMVRLGLWGGGTAFPDFRYFLGALDKGGVGALELVAMDMKTRGMYVCRTLSYQGAEFEVIEAPLEAEMLDMYKKAAEFWAELRVELLSASAIVPDEKPNSGQLWRLYWSSHQRFFRHMCMSAKVPASVRLAKQALVENKCVVIGLQSTGEARTEEAVTKYGVELDDFVSGPRELLLKFVEDNYPLPPKPDSLPGEDSVKELQRKRHSATPGVSYKGRVRKAAKLKPESDVDSDELSETDSDHDTESDDEFQICNICSGEEERKKLLCCSCCGQLVHASCLVPPIIGMVAENWECHSCVEKTEDYLQAKRAYLAEVLKRYEAAVERKAKILEIIRSLALPNNPLDDIINQERKKLLCCSCCGQLVHASCLVPPIIGMVAENWECHSCVEKTEDYLQAKRAYLAEVLKRYEAAVERKAKILEIIRSLALPNNPLDDIINQLGGPDNIAEMTGRRGMLVRASNGKGVIYQARNTKEVALEMVNMHEKQLFMDGKKLVAIISEAGSAGVSLQADRRALNQKRRVHLTLELPWSADRAIQQFGRTHRSNQASAPEYRLLFTNLGGERRFASIVAKRIETLGALTQGDRRAGPSLSAYNYDSVYGKKALMMMYRGIMEQDSLPVVPPGCTSEKPETIEDYIIKAKAALVSVGIVRDTILGKGKDHGGRIVESDMHDVGRFLNRLLGLPPDIQNRLFELFVSILDHIVQNARSEGHFDSGIVDMRANAIELQGPPKTVYVDHLSGASTILFTFTLDRGITWESASTLLEEKRKSGADSSYDGFYESKREWMGRRHFLLAYEGSTSGMFKIIRPAVGEAIREMPLDEVKNKYRKITSVEKACKGWEDEYILSSTQCMHGPKCKLANYCTVGRRLQEVNVLGGLILPVWGTIEKALSKQARQSHKRIRVVRVETTTDNQRVVGLVIPNSAVETVLQELGWVQDIDD
ncbi:strawberry notch-like protein [Thalictrum thalictroides]|uniref:Strawberry notch-like protein n=1 Tax=Thalictrum thalictroides TaxID=46969 RepID=A0A7J6WH47_THATH|nr:strawberry notch-like protein [Thalictrum thalictroides]